MVDEEKQSMKLGTIVAIVFGIFVLVLLVWGFSSDWNYIWNTNTVSSDADVNADTVPSDAGVNADDISQACALSCSSENEYDFCTKNQTVNIDGEVVSLNLPCSRLAGGEYNIEFCPGLCPM